ncbi:MAG: SRPBCC family protein [Streptosporangiales bacterium]|nr:SRPBCC family protein [Streptosporangiales bacterium]MBO0890661.1 SRPBCC family protein [Acidothermales bacterium]
MAQQTGSSIDVTASRPDVMAVISDFEAYPDWANVKRTEVLERDASGRASRVRFVIDAGIVKDDYVLAFTWTGDERVDWTLAKPGSVVTVMDGAYLLTDSGRGTKVTYELTVDVRIPMIGMLKRKAERLIVDTALNGLKKRVEER